MVDSRKGRGGGNKGGRKEMEPTSAGERERVTESCASDKARASKAKGKEREGEERVG